MLFCPICHSILFLTKSESMGSTSSQFECCNCGYYYPITKPIVNTSEFPELKKQLINESQLSENIENLSAKIIAICPSCNHNEAYFYSIQIRSADEPSTNFYTCTKCRKKWRE